MSEDSKHSPIETNSQSNKPAKTRKLTSAQLKAAADSFTATAVVKQPKRKSSWKLTLSIALIILLGIGAGFIGVKVFDSYQAKAKEEAQQKVEIEKEQKKAEAIREADNPLSVLIGKVDAPVKGSLKSTVKKDKLKVGASELSIKSAKMKPTINGCNIELVTELCLAARGSMKNVDFDVFVVKDISRTRLLENPSEFKEVKTAGSTIAAYITVDMDDNKKEESFGALTLNGTTGFILAFPEGTSAEKVQEVLKVSTVI